MVLTHIAVLSIKFLLATEFLKFILRKVNKNYLIEFQFQTIQMNPPLVCTSSITACSSITKKHRFHVYYHFYLDLFSSFVLTVELGFRKSI
jgi:hypothetical protein